MRDARAASIVRDLAAAFRADRSVSADCGCHRANHFRPGAARHCQRFCGGEAACACTVVRRWLRTRWEELAVAARNLRQMAAVARNAGRLDEAKALLKRAAHNERQLERAR